MLNGQSKFFANKRGVTFLELILAASLAGIIVIGILNIYVSSQKILTKTTDLSQVQIESIFVMEKLTRGILPIFDFNLVDKNTLQIKTFSNFTIDPRPSPDEFKDDANFIWSEYKFDKDKNEIYLKDDINNPSSPEIKLAENVEFLEFSNQNEFIKISLKLTDREKREKLLLISGTSPRCMPRP